MNEDLMKNYADLFARSQQECRPDQALARIVQQSDGTRRLEPTALADTSSSDFQRLFGTQGTVSSALGVAGAGDFTPPLLLGPPLAPCPTGATGCSLDPFFHFPELEKDTANCLYIPTFTDVPMTISMATYFAQAFLKEVPFQQITETIDSESKKIINDIVYANVYFNYVPLAVLLLVVVWVLVIHGTLDWGAGVLLTAVIVVVLWLGYMLFDTFTRSVNGNVFSRIKDEVVDAFKAKNEAILCNLIKGYYGGAMHMLVPEAAICKSSSLTGPLGFTGCACFDTGISIPTKVVPITIKIPNPTNILNRQLGVGGEKRCDGINNNDTLLPLIDKACPCLRDIDGFTLSGVSESKKKEIFDCVVESVGLSPDFSKDFDKLIGCVSPESPLNPSLCALICPTLQCSTQGTPFSVSVEDCSTRFPP